MAIPRSLFSTEIESNPGAGATTVYTSTLPATGRKLVALATATPAVVVNKSEAFEEMVKE